MKTNKKRIIQCNGVTPWQYAKLIIGNFNMLYFSLLITSVVESHDGVQDNSLGNENLNVNSLYVLHLLDHISFVSI